ncbi:NEAT domain-containing protein [Paenibacillus filicis]|uniref:NEAT domain-containing protein n=1 Tax=Paenibacillus filicis TaxID=669464 RepID=UPI00311A4580
MALFLSTLLSALNVSIGTAWAENFTSDGEYAVNYRYLKDGSSDSSAANPFMHVENTGKLIVKNGSTKFEHQITLKNYNYFKYLGFRKPGAEKAYINPVTHEIQGMDGYQTVPVRDAGDGSGNKIVTINVEDMAKKPDLLMHIVIKDDPDYGPDFVYDNWYNVQLLIDTNNGQECVNPVPPVITLQQLQGLVSEAKSVTASTYEGTSLGEYPTGSKQPLNANISLANGLIVSGNAPSEVTRDVYHSLTLSLDKYKFSVNSQQNKTGLTQQFFESQEAYNNLHEIGYAECKEGFTYPPVTPGEYSKGTKDSLNTYLTSISTNTMPRSVLQNVYATESNIRTATTRLTSYQPNKYVVVETPKLIVLDSLNPTSTPSQKAPEIAETATFINTSSNASQVGNDRVRANLTFKGVAPTEIVQSTPNRYSVNNGAGFSIEGLDYANEAQRALPLLKSTDAQKKVYQVIVRDSGIQDKFWEGRSYVRYKLNGETKEVYISYNGNQLDALNQTLNEAKKLYGQSTTPLPGEEQAYAEAKAVLQAKIDEAQPVASNLAETRPKIVTATTALKQAADAFKAKAQFVLNFSALHATKDEASSMDRYFVKPGNYSDVNGKKRITLTLKDSTTIPSFKVEQNGVLVETTVVSRDTAANTRVVQFETADLTTLLNAQVHVSTVANGQPYEMDHNIRLRLYTTDKASLAAVIASAQGKHDAAVEGTAVGQYPAGSKATLKTAIDAAKVVNASASAAQAAVESATAALQQAVTTFEAAVIVTNPGGGGSNLPDGDYAIGFRIYKKGSNENSVMYSYVDPNSGKLTIVDGKKFVSFKLKQNAEILSFKTDRNGVLVETDKVSVDQAANMRVVRFPVSDLSARLSGWVKIYWVLPPPIGLYDHEYDVEIGFDQPSIPETQYDLNFSALHATKDEASSMDRYFVKPGKYSDVNGKKKITLTLKDSTTIPSFKVEQNGVLVETTVVSRDTAANTRVVQFETADLTTLLNAQVHVSTVANGQPYEMDHNIRLKLYATDKASLATLIASAQSKYDAAVEGTSAGQYPAGSKAILKTAIDAAKSVNASASASQQAIESAAAALKQAVTVFDAAVIVTTPGGGGGQLPNGEYPIEYHIYKKGTSENSVMYDYVDRNSGKLIVDGDQKYVTFTLNKNAEILSFKTERNGVLVETDKVSVDTAANTRVVKFPVTDLSKRLNGWVKIYWDLPPPLGLYDHEYDVELGFGQPVVPGVQQDLNFSVLHATKDEASSMDRYFVKPGKYTDVNGKKRITLTLKDSTTIPSLKVEQNGVLVETTIVSRDTAANTRVVQFETADLTTLLNAQVHVSTIANGQPYEMDHNIRLKLSPTDKAGLTALIASAQSKHDAAVEGTATGQYPAGSKAALKAAIDAAKAVSSSISASQQAVDAAGVALQKALNVLIASIILANDNYTMTLPATITDSSGTPLSNFVSTGAKLNVNNGKQVATFELKGGVTLKKVQKKKADGTLEDVQLQQQAVAAKQKEAVTILAADSGSKSISFEVDRTADYVLTLAGADHVEREFVIPLANSTVAPVPAGPGPGGPSGPGTGPVQDYPDGTYSINFKFLKYNADTVSVMHDYVVTPGKLTIDNGIKYFEFILKQSKQIPQFKIDNGGGLSTPEVSASDETKNTRTFKFTVPNLNDKLHGWVDVNWPEINYVHNYDVHLQFDKSSLKSIPNGANPGEVDVKPLSQAYTAGEYSIEYELNLRGSKQTSITNAYIKHPAKLIVKDGKSYLQVTVSHKEVTGLKIENESVLKDAEIVSTNEQRNERTLQFEVKDTKTKIFAQFTMAVPGKYSGEYGVEFVLDGTSIMPYKEQAVEGGKDPGKQPTKPGLSSFADVEDHWAKALIERAVGLGLVNGYEDGTFRPNDAVTRAEFTALLGRTLKLEGSEDELNFTDAAEIPSWVKPQLGAVVKAGIIGGYEDGTFQASRQISRTELAVIVTRALKLDVDTHAQASFADAGSIPQWAQAHVAAAHQHGLISGRDHNEFAPNESATRAEAVKLILALLSEVK